MAERRERRLLLWMVMGVEDERHSKETAKFDREQLQKLAARSVRAPSDPGEPLERSAKGSSPGRPYDTPKPDGAEFEDDERKTQRVQARQFQGLGPAVVGSARAVNVTSGLDPVLKPKLVEVTDSACASEPRIVASGVMHEDLASASLIKLALEQLRSGDLDDGERAYLERIVARSRPVACAARESVASTTEVPERDGSPATVAEVASAPRTATETLPNPPELVEAILATAPIEKRLAVEMRPITKPPMTIPTEPNGQPAEVGAAIPEPDLAAPRTDALERYDIGLVIVACVIVLGAVGAIAMFATAS